MAHLLSIGSKTHIDFIRDRLARDFKSLKVEGIDVNCQEEQRGEFAFIDYHRTNQVDDHAPASCECLIKYRVAQTLSDMIVNQWEEHLLDRIIKCSYYYFTQDERADIGKRARILLNGCEKRKESKTFQMETRRASIFRLLMEYLEQEDHLNLEGFINFRLKGYWSQLEAVVDQAVDEYLMEKEHTEFVRLLRYFVEIQAPRVEKVQVVLRPSGFFQLFDGEENIINNDTLEGFVVDLAESEINYEDLLVSALITIAPRQILMHLPDPNKVRNTISTLQSVFEERLSICPGCARCLHSNQKKF